MSVSPASFPGKPERRQYWNTKQRCPISLAYRTPWPRSAKAMAPVTLLQGQKTGTGRGRVGGEPATCQLEWQVGRRGDGGRWLASAAGGGLAPGDLPLAPLPLFPGPLGCAPR